MATTTSKAVTFFLPIDPMPAPRVRCVARGGFASAYSPKEYTVWKDAVIALIRDAVPAGTPAAGPVSVTLDVQATRPRTSKLAHPSPDVDNYAKGVLDAVTQSERCWVDDKQVTHLTVSKRWAPEGSPPGIRVSIIEN